MKYGTVNRVDVYDAGEGAYDVLKAQVSVDFTIDRRVLFEFMDALRPIDRSAKREPIAAILEHSAQPTEAFIPLDGTATEFLRKAINNG